MNHSKKPIAGFTLIEVLIAMAILAVAFGAIFFAANNHIQQLAYLQDKTAANWVGMNAIAQYQIHLVGSGIAGDNESGSENMLHDSWHWTLTSNRTQNKGVLRLEVTVKKNDLPAELIHLVGYAVSNEP